MGYYAPENIIDNEYFTQFMDTSDKWISERTGIKERRFVNKGQGPADIAVPSVELALENDAEDFLAEKDHYEIICHVSQYDQLAEALEKAAISPDSFEIAYLPNNLVSISDVDTAKKVLKLVENLEDLEDVKAVHGNYDIDETLIESFDS